MGYVISDYKSFALHFVSKVRVDKTTKKIDIRTFGVSVSGSGRELTADWKSNLFLYFLLFPFSYRASL